MEMQFGELIVELDIPPHDRFQFQFILFMFNFWKSDNYGKLEPNPFPNGSVEICTTRSFLWT